MTVIRLDHFESCTWYQFRKCLLLAHGKKNIRFDPDGQCFCLNTTQCGRDATPVPAYVVRIHSLAQYMIAECIEPFCKFFTLVPLIGFAPVSGQPDFICFSLASMIGFIMSIRNKGNTPGYFHSFHPGIWIVLLPGRIGFNGKTL